MRSTADFSISASPSSQTVTPGVGASYTVTLTAQNSYSSPVNLSVSGFPAGASFSANPVTPTATGATATLSVTTTASTPGGTYSLIITGTGTDPLAITHSTSVTLVVNPPPTADFSISATPSSQIVVKGNTATYTVTITPSNGFTGAVALSLTGCPSGASCSLPASVTVSRSTAVTATLSVTTSSTTSNGNGTLTITGRNVSLVHSARVTLLVKWK